MAAAMTKAPSFAAVVSSPMARASVSSSRSACQVCPQARMRQQPTDQHSREADDECEAVETGNGLEAGNRLDRNAVLTAGQGCPLGQAEIDDGLEGDRHDRKKMPEQTQQRQAQKQNAESGDRDACGQTAPEPRAE